MGDKNKKPNLGEFEAVVLMAILRLREDAYGVTIRREIEVVAGRQTSIGAVYTTLDRMEEKGFLSARLGEATCERGGKAKRYYKIEGAGMLALEDAEETRRRLLQGVDPKLLGGLA